MIIHWVTKLADKIVKERGYKVTVASGITTSGPPHLGTVCEFLYPWALVKELKRRGVETYFIFVGDIMDAFDNIPSTLKKYERELKQHLGKPLCRVPDPYGCHGSYGEHFLSEVEKVMKEFNVALDEIVGSNTLYERGYYDKYLKLFIEKFDYVKRILEETSLRKLPENWKDIVLPICKKCGKIATTRVLEFDTKNNRIRYVCDKDIGYTKGCGYKGYVTIDSHEWKLAWRLDWPSRQDFLKVDVEGAGVDHHTRGGSWDTAVAIHEKVFGKKPPIGFKYGFILIHGRKMSKSKGLGDLKYVLSLVPPEILKYFLFKGSLEENKNFKDDARFLLRLYEEFKQVGLLIERRVEVKDPALAKKVYAYTLATDVSKAVFHISFADILVLYQIYKNWEHVKRRLGYPEEVERLSKYIRNWINLGIVPKEYLIEFKPTPIKEYREVVKEFAQALNPNMRDVDVHNLVYEVARKFNVNPKDLFKILYTALLGQPRGPRLGRLIVALGIEKVKETLLKLI